ncbi:hypothetical protein [Frankia sp. Cr2]|uniref:hypothetical protein n=1 Tax=Frankia sp. Cr2 TaxID=3073932 RepID=UPI002AD434B1|nr:hypothetical protein [Frankia sp. Cr2]
MLAVSQSGTLLSGSDMEENAHRHSGDYQAVWWVNADNLTAATTGLIDFAAALSLPIDGSPATVLRLLWGALGDRTDWLLIYDNVNDPASLADLRPPDSGRLLLTSRDPTLGHVADLVDVGEFDRVESIALLQRRYPTLSDAHADQVAAAVGDLPLAVEEAGCFLTGGGRTASPTPDSPTPDSAPGTVPRHSGRGAVPAGRA